MKQNISKEKIDFSNLEMDEKASKNLKENKYENIPRYFYNYCSALKCWPPLNLW